MLILKKIFFCRPQFNKEYACLFLFTTVSVFFLTGCESIPPGTPPEGPIVSINATSNHPLSPKDAINNMTTAIAICPQLYANKNIPIINLYPTKITDSQKKYEDQLNYLTTHLYRNIFEMNITKFPHSLANDQCDFLLASTFSRIYNDILEEENNQPLHFEWKVSLLSPKNTSKPIWKRSIEVIIDRGPPQSKYPQGIKNDI